jgi:hypothetical protein
MNPRCLPSPDNFRLWVLVFQILVQFAESKDWAQAALSTLPSRKGIQSKEE